MKHLCKECIHYGLCEYHTITDRMIECKNFFPEIVYCKDCKYSSEPQASRLTLYENNYEICYCNVFDKNLPNEFFCGFAERR